LRFSAKEWEKLGMSIELLVEVFGVVYWKSNDPIDAVAEPFPGSEMFKGLPGKLYGRLQNHGL
jgi:hypothetical protein